MTSQKLRTFEEKMNAFLKGLESGDSRRTSKSYFLEKYSYLEAKEVETLFNLSQEIRDMVVELAGQTMQHHMLYEVISANMRATLKAKYPYLDEARISRLISHGIASYR